MKLLKEIAIENKIEITYVMVDEKSNSSNIKMKSYLRDDEYT